jgi:hypothetical protein
VHGPDLGPDAGTLNLPKRYFSRFRDLFAALLVRLHSRGAQISRTPHAGRVRLLSTVVGSILCLGQFGDPGELFH